jgi:DNA-binding cell septation regulator SpoVG
MIALLFMASKLLKSERGFFVAMPRPKTGEKHRDIFHPINAKARKRLVDVVLIAYDKCKSNEQFFEHQVANS